MVIAALGIAEMVRTATRPEPDGIIAFDPEVTRLLTVTGLVTAIVGGLLHGLAARAGFRWAAWLALLAFAAAAFWPAVLFAGGLRLVGSQAWTPSSSLGLAVLAWLLTLAAEFGVAWLVRRRPENG